MLSQVEPAWSGGSGQQLVAAVLEGMAYTAVAFDIPDLEMPPRVERAVAILFDWATFALPGLPSTSLIKLMVSGCVLLLLVVLAILAFVYQSNYCGIANRFGSWRMDYYAGGAVHSIPALFGVFFIPISQSMIEIVDCVHDGEQAKKVRR